MKKPKMISAYFFGVQATRLKFISTENLKVQQQ